MAPEHSIPRGPSPPTTRTASTTKGVLRAANSGPQASEYPEDPRKVVPGESTRGCGQRPPSTRFPEDPNSQFRERMLGERCSQSRALSPGTDCSNHRGTECSGVAVCSPEHSRPELPSLGPRGTQVLGGHCSPPRAHTSRYSAFLVVGGLRCSGATAHDPEHARPGTWSSQIIRELRYSGTTVHGPEHPLPGLSFLALRGDHPRERSPRGNLLV